MRCDLDNVNAQGEICTAIERSLDWRRLVVSVRAVENSLTLAAWHQARERADKTVEYARRRTVMSQFSANPIPEDSAPQIQSKTPTAKHKFEGHQKKISSSCTTMSTS
ncbi:hypothetical protein K503DRAFT_803074 [Rhizopogon vinicolor AM-OR11-026]|uniref:Uncharacterized protein n=1 Tax=Rhizopogon vinicolor AM-OR11-026 TaxID=1314800 RepID=A0A1B7MR77_9AGAM|nr:hypothetical protein K503DRAFT_803074 [Rhizopogon vinicolor AM-OR11-026]